MNERTNERTDGRTDGWIDGLMDGCIGSLSMFLGSVDLIGINPSILAAQQPFENI